ncbi:MAG: hypothetical protein IJA02_05630 [Clostridia bacterium]|nr:hypothetical protein [Clostridia bacterium]
MKKIISFMLSILFVLASFNIAFAADEHRLYLNETENVTLSADEELVYTFIPEFEGNYKITVSAGAKCFVEVSVSNENNVLSTGAIVATDVKYYKGYNLQQIMKPLDFNKEIYVTVKTGGTISIKLADQTTFADETWNNSPAVPDGLITCFTPSTVSVTVELAELESIKPEEKATVTDGAYFSFTAVKTGKHVLFCETVGGAEPEIAIYDCNGEVAVQGEGKEFTAEFIAGENYIIKCRNAARSGYDSSALGSYTFEINHVHTFGEWESNNDETFFKDGTYTHSCVCGEQETEINEGSAIIAVIFNRIYEAFIWLLNFFVK